MPICPECQSELPDDFGLVNCSSCGRAAFIGMDGEIQQDEVPPPVAADEAGPDEQYNPEEASPIEPSSAIELGGEYQSFESKEPNLDWEKGEGVDLETPEYSEPSTGHDSGQEEYLQSDIEHQVEAPIEDPQYTHEAPVDVPPVPPQQYQEAGEDGLEEASGFDEPMPPSQDYQEPEPLESGGSEPILSQNETIQKEDSLEDVVAFGNSELSSASEGSLKVKVNISGIDDSELREQVLMSLEDARFFMDAQEVISQISDGKLQLTGLSPVKASVLINRLKPIKVNISWEQYAIQQTDEMETEPPVEEPPSAEEDMGEA